MKRLIALTTPFLLVMLCGCGTSLPTEHDAEQFIRQDIVRQNQPYILVNFHKTNGQNGHDGRGVETYIMAFEGEVEFTEDCYLMSGGGLVVWRGRNPMNGSPSNVKKGERAKVPGHVYFDKTEKGWQPSHWDRL